MRIARELIDPDADKVVRRLARHGHQAYLVGGCVRDLLLGRRPKDFDVATSATPKEIKQLFRNCRIIGRRFRLAHIFFGGKIIETSTFRANPRQGDEDGELLIRRDNVFGTDTEDAQRRDFTINGLFYDVEAERVIDHVGGLEDLAQRVVATIGNPDIRFQEDPVRMLRAIKFAARLDFSISPAAYKAILRRGGEIAKSAQPRVLEELYRLLRGGAARRSMELMVEVGVASSLSPHLATMFSDVPLIASLRDHASEENEEDVWAATWAGEGAKASAQRARDLEDDEEDEDDDDDDYEDTEPEERGDDERRPTGAAETDDDDRSSPLFVSFLRSRDELAARRSVAWRMLDELDRMFASDREMTNSLAVSAICAPFVVPSLLQNELRPLEAMQMVEEVLVPLVRELQIARRDAERSRQTLLAQRRLVPARRRRGKPMALVRRDYFEEALSIYELLGAATERDVSDSGYWRKLQAQGVTADTSARRSGSGGKRRRRRRGGRRRRRTAADGADTEQEPVAGLS